MKLLYLASGAEPGPPLSEEFRTDLARYGDFRVVLNGKAMSETDRLALLREADVVVTGWSTAPIPEGLADDPGHVRYILHLTGELRKMIPARVIESGILVTNWGDAPAADVAEGAVALLLASLKVLPDYAATIAAGSWGCRRHAWSSSLHGLALGIYGMGVIGRQFVEYLRPFRPRLSAFDPFAEIWPEGVRRVSSLDELFAGSEAIAIHAGLTPATRRSVDARRLAMLPDGGLIVNTARGAIIDQPALFAELERGRLRAALDVFDTDGHDWLPPGHPARGWSNLIATCHRIGGAGWPDPSRRPPEFRRSALQQVALDNLERFASGKEPRFRITPHYFETAT